MLRVLGITGTQPSSVQGPVRHSSYLKQNWLDDNQDITPPLPPSDNEIGFAKPPSASDPAKAGINVNSRVQSPFAHGVPADHSESRGYHPSHHHVVSAWPNAMTVHHNKMVEQWGHMRENTHKTWHFNNKTSMQVFIWVGVVPLSIWALSRWEQKQSNLQRGVGPKNQEYL